MVKLFQVDHPKPIQSPATGEQLLRFVGDSLRFTLQAPGPRGNPSQAGDARHGTARLRTNLGSAAARRREIIAAHAGQPVAANSSWRDLPMHKTSDGWEIQLPLAETGYFKAKAYWLDEKNHQHWPDGPDVGIAVHPNGVRTANTLYCAFTRLFGATHNLITTADPGLEARLQSLESLGYATLPPSGKFRDLAKHLPHIVRRLGCRILHLLPVNPSPTTYARFGRFGSPYAALDLTAVDPALVEFDQRTTGVEQFCELTHAAHSLDARVFIDIVINHTGWGSRLQENHPEFFLKKPDGDFASPGAWGTVWEDLVELKLEEVALWDLIAESLLTWCRRGVDGFRCDAGYKIPAAVWQYIVAHVQGEFPETIFLLEGLGGSWDATEQLLTEGGMQWAYSELFQNYSGPEVARYLDYSIRQSRRIGSYVHYSETHDNSRLAAKKPGAGQTADDPASSVSLPAAPATAGGRAWSLLRNRLCALTSPSGGSGFTCGVEWLATEKIRVHGNTGLNWDSPDNLLPELARLNQVISDHPAFFDGATLTRLSELNSPVYALLRESAEGTDAVLVLVNTDPEKTGVITLARPADRELPATFELLGQPLPHSTVAGLNTTFTILPGGAYCLAPTPEPAGLSGDDYRRARAQAAWAIQALSQIAPLETLSGLDWRWLAEQVRRAPALFLAVASEFGARAARTPLAEVLAEAGSGTLFPRVVEWSMEDARRITLVPPGHWLLITDRTPFRASLKVNADKSKKANAPVQIQSIAVDDGFVACLDPNQAAGEATLSLERYAPVFQKVEATLRFLPPEPSSAPSFSSSDLALLTNGRGGMARMVADLGNVHSKYDCVLAANLNPAVPVDRHVFVKRLRAWVNADGFLSPLDCRNLISFEAGPPAVWNFVANAGTGRTVEIELRAAMVEGENTTVLQFSRPTKDRAHGSQLPAGTDVRLTLRPDIEDRNFHSETRRNGGADSHFASHCHPMSGPTPLATGPLRGFAFTPASDRHLRVFTDRGEFHPQPEWCENIHHPVEQGRGQTPAGDAYSPGWFEVPLAKGSHATLVLTAESGGILEEKAEEKSLARLDKKSSHPETALAPDFAERLARAAGQFVVRRDEGKTIIAGYPWFLDWGRDSLICARGLLAAGRAEEVKQLLLTFARFEQDGTLPNTIHGNDVSNRDTSDAPLWFAVACEDLGEDAFFNQKGKGGRTLRDVLTSIAENYCRGTPNGIRMDASSGLIWSPSHFTWMDTNYPAGTPREGYPVEIQALWIRLLRWLGKTGAGAEPGRKQWRERAEQAAASFQKLFWLEGPGWFADVLLAPPGMAAGEATPSDALRSNCLLAVSLGLVSGVPAKRCVAAALKHLVVPGALRSLAPLPVSVPLPIYNAQGGLINNPPAPYWPRYEGDEDSRRKPAYHNGTAWTWTFPAFCEALARAWDFSPAAVAAAKAYLGSSVSLLNQGCLGQLPEIVDGDAPHTQRGCDAQAWGVTEALRVWKLLERSKPGHKKE